MSATWAIAAAKAGVLTMGLETGALLFVSAVSARTVEHAVAEEDADFVRRLFPVWWPYGRDLMAPLGVAALATNALAAFDAHHTQAVAVRNAHLACAAAAGGIIAWTVFVMGEDIDSLRNGTATETLHTARNFCRKHHVRLIASAVCFGGLLCTYSLK
jgi:hypothetical protein